MLNPNNLKTNTTNVLEVANNIINASIENIEKLANLNIEASKHAIEESTAAFKHLSAITNPQDVITYAKNLATTTATKNAEICHNTYEIISATHSKINKILQAQASQFNTEGFSKLLSTFQASKFGFDTSALNSWVDTLNQVASNVSKLATEATETVKSVVNTAKTAATHSVETAKKAANETVETVIKSAKVAQAQAVEVAQKSAEAIVTATKKSANTVNTASKTAVK